MLSKVAERWRSLHSGARWAVGLVTFLVALNAVGVALDTLYGGATSGPPSSSYTTDGSGTAAFADLLRGDGRDVSALRNEPSRTDLHPNATLFVLSPREVLDEDARAISRFVSEGGRLVVAVDGPAGWLHEVVDGAPVWDDEEVSSSAPLVPVAETDGVEDVVGAGTGSWEEEGAALPVLGGDAVTVMVADSGEGRVVLIADPTILQNQFLAEGDNAAFGLASAGDPGREVLFAETFHGYDRSTGIRALPARARWMLAGLTFGALLAMLAYGKRFGPPDKHARDLPPPRRAYVDAVAATLGRMKDHDAAVEPLRARARSALARRAGVPENASDDELLRSAEESGLKGSADLLFRPVRDKEGLITAGKAAAKLTRGSK